MSDKGIDLGGYVQVKDRIAKFYELFGGGRLVTTDVRATSEPDGKPRVWVEAKAYRTVDDPLPGVGWSWLELPGSTNFTRGSELENAETSAWGRAIGSLGILIDVSIASQHEIESKAQPAKPAPRPAVAPNQTARASRDGVASDARSASGSQGAVAKAAPTNEPPEISDAELDSLAGVVATNTAVLRPPTVASQAAERVVEHRAARVAEQVMTLSDFMILKGEKGISFGPDFTAACLEVSPVVAWSRFDEAKRYALAVKLGMVE